MSDYERSRRSRDERDDRETDVDPPRRAQSNRPPIEDEPVRRSRTPAPGDELSGSAPRSRYADAPEEPRRSRSSRSAQEPAGAEPRSTGTGRAERGTTGRYSDRFRTSTERYDEVDAPEAVSTRDPYDRLRRTSSRPPRRVEPDDYEGDYLDPDDYDDVERLPSRGRAKARRGAAAAGAGAVAVAGAASMRKMGSRLANPPAAQRPLMFGAAAAAGSLLLMLILIAVRYGSAPDWIPVDINAEGTILALGTKAAIWRLPVFALFSSLMALGLGWWLRTREPFATQFLAVSAIMINVIVWVGVITLLW